MKNLKISHGRGRKSLTDDELILLEFEKLQRNFRSKFYFLERKKKECLERKITEILKQKKSNK